MAKCDFMIKISQKREMWYNKKKRGLKLSERCNAKRIICYDMFEKELDLYGILGGKNGKEEKDEIKYGQYT